MSGRRHRFERYGPDGPFDDRTGNGIVNNRPENELSGLGQGLGESLAGGDGPGGDEVALRRLLQGAVQDLEPSDGALDHLRRAVPARRARKRQALVGVAAAALLIGTAVPAFVHVASSGSSDTARPVNAGHGEEAQGGTGDETGVVDGEAGTDDPPADSQGTEHNDDGQKDQPGEKPGAGTPDGATGGTAVPSGTAAATAPACDPGRLGVVSAEAGQPDADGKVYGTFRIANVSQSGCVISGGGSVGFQATGAADQARISVVTHTTGDAAGGLPDPSQEVGSLLLEPNAAYEVKFAWVPSDSCPTTGASPDPSPTDGGSSGASTGTGTSGEGTQAQLAGEDGGTQDGSVAVSHTAEGGGPVASTTVANACAGTIYRTGVLQAQ
jgi:hypothetical protein